MITRVADAHREFFSSTAAIASAKAEIFQGLEGLSIGVLNRDDKFFDSLHSAALKHGAKKIISFGHHPDSDFRLSSIEHHDNGMTIKSTLGELFFLLKCMEVTC